MADLGLFQALPVEIEMNPAAQRFELIQFFPPDQHHRGLMYRLGFRFCGGHVHQLPKEFLVEIRRRAYG